MASDWFDYLVCSPAELADLVADTPWHITDIDTTDHPYYLATLNLRR